MKPESQMDMRNLVIFSTEKEIIDLGVIDEKGIAKSVENGMLWTIHPESGRLLPYETEHRLLSIERKSSWVEARLGTSKCIENTAAENSENKLSAATEPVSSAGIPAEAPTGTVDDVLSGLSALIRERNLTRPEGSYTTYLFDEGLEKIRKKTGEEAVELILATEHDRIVSEGADLIYHMLVLLEASGITVNELVTELVRRRKEGS